MLSCVKLPAAVRVPHMYPTTSSLAPGALESPSLKLLCFTATRKASLAEQHVGVSTSHRCTWGIIAPLAAKGVDNFRFTESGLHAARGLDQGRRSAYHSPDEIEAMPSMPLHLLDTPLPTCISDVSAVSDHALA